MTADTYTAGFGASTLSVVDLLRERMHAASPPTEAPRHPTGMFPLDAVLDGGFRRQDLVLVTGRPGAGKTIMALQWARAVAMHGARAIYVCYEHSPETLLERFVALEEASAGREARRFGHEQGELGARADIGGDAQCTASEPRPADTFDRVAPYGLRLRFAMASGRYTDVDAIERLLPDGNDHNTVIFVDYLDKIPTPRRSFASDSERTTYLVQALKDLAMRRNITVVAVVAADKHALTKRRLRLHDMNGSSALLYEADVALVLNEKSQALSKNHLAYDAERAEQAKRYLVVSVEKNRHGASGLDMEFVKEFASFAVDADGRFVTENLVDDILYVE